MQDHGVGMCLGLLGVGEGLEHRAVQSGVTHFLVAQPPDAPEQQWEHEQGQAESNQAEKLDCGNELWEGWWGGSDRGSWVTGGALVWADGSSAYRKDTSQSSGIGLGDIFPVTYHLDTTNQKHITDTQNINRKEYKHNSKENYHHQGREQEERNREEPQKQSENN